MRKHRNIWLGVAAFLTYAVAWTLFAAPIDQMYWNLRYRLSERSAAEAVSIVRLDDLDRRGIHAADDVARVLQAVRAQDPQHVFLDIGPTDASPLLQQELRHWQGRLSLVARYNVAANKSGWFADTALAMPDPSIRNVGELVIAGFRTNFWGYVEAAPCAFAVNGHNYRSLATAMSGSGCAGGELRPDFTVDPRTIDVHDGRALVADPRSADKLSGRTVLVTTAMDPEIGTLGYFGRNQQSLPVFEVASANSARVREVSQVRLDFLGIFTAVLLLLGGRIAAQPWRWAIYGVAVCVAAAGPLVAEHLGILATQGFAFVALAVYGTWRLWMRWRQRVIETSNSGLPNFVALGKQTVPAGFNVVVAVIGRYEEFLATLPSDLHEECARQIARRFSVGCRNGEIFHGDGGHFAWIEQDRDPDAQIEHFEGMRALFSAPLLVGGHMFDTNVHFGIDRNAQFDTMTRLNTSIASATEALKNGRTIEQFEANRLANAPWELSLLARIDKGMTNGDIWLAYQPQWDYGENRMCGAEALIRWDDPVRGPIRPDEFILQAERAGRIDALTYWVLEQAITSAEAMNAVGERFQMSINLSAQLVDKASLISATREIVTRRGVDCTLLTIEVTETASVYNRPAAIQNLQALRAMGFRLSIDDFGTGEASLCYLADLPSDELKLDRRFISRLTSSDRDRKIVKSTIGLAHALGQVVVAEGIEDIATFEMLRRMRCDVGQGYYIGRPDTFEQLRARYMTPGRVGARIFTTC